LMFLRHELMVWLFILLIDARRFLVGGFLLCLFLGGIQPGGGGGGGRGGGWGGGRDMLASRTTTAWSGCGRHRPRAPRPLGPGPSKTPTPGGTVPSCRLRQTPAGTRWRAASSDGTVRLWDVHRPPAPPNPLGPASDQPPPPSIVRGGGGGGAGGVASGPGGNHAGEAGTQHAPDGHSPGCGRPTGPPAPPHQPTPHPPTPPPPPPTPPPHPPVSSASPWSGSTRSVYRLKRSPPIGTCWPSGSA